jgi:hypothetical protein
MMSDLTVAERPDRVVTLTVAPIRRAIIVFLVAFLLFLIVWAWFWLDRPLSPKQLVEHARTLGGQDPLALVFAAIPLVFPLLAIGNMGEGWRGTVFAFDAPSGTVRRNDAVIASLADVERVAVRRIQRRDDCDLFALDLILTDGGIQELLARTDEGDIARIAGELNAVLGRGLPPAGAPSPSRRRGLPPWFPWPFLAFGTAALIAASVVAYQTRQFMAEASQADGVVVDLIGHRGSKGSVTYAPKVAFRAEGTPAPIEFVGAVSSNPPAFAVGEHVEVVYDVRRPQQARIATTFELWAMPLIFGGLGLIFTTIGLAFALALRRRRERLG